MQWEPAEAAWLAYIKLEKRQEEYDRVRSIFERYTVVHPEPASWIRWAKFEEVSLSFIHKVIGPQGIGDATQTLNLRC